MTAAGFKKVKDELRRLKTVARPEVIRDIEEARAHGDLSENAEYEAAKEKQAFIEGRINMLDDRLSRAEVIDAAKIAGTDRVVFGVTVTLSDEETGDEMSYQIVGEDEADIDQGKISISAPIARALIGKKLDEEVLVKTPGGLKTFVLMDINVK
ncbi:MAG: transcription elongation factor GreA [Deltaproteobacteria bacterium]|nr:transcription elongation factor GreA [Candidatus Anaeroferrophillus wilburensis]MBN2889894.1 transcription elongation factor GreA [Deltaproteobacteria bacterium]